MKGEDHRLVALDSRTWHKKPLSPTDQARRYLRVSAKHNNGGQDRPQPVLLRWVKTPSGWVAVDPEATDS